MRVRLVVTNPVLFVTEDRAQRPIQLRGSWVHTARRAPAQPPQHLPDLFLRAAGDPVRPRSMTGGV